MLVLTRRVGEEVLLRLTKDLPEGTEIQVALLESGYGRARIGLDAPEEIRIVRTEIDGAGSER